MLTTIAVLAGALTLGQPDRSEWLLLPQYGPGLELIYNGTYTEKSLMPGIERQREYRLENTIFFTEGQPRQWNVAVMTVLSLRGRQAEDNKPLPPASLRLELAEVDKLGRLRSKKGASILMPLDSPPTLETGVFVEFAGVRKARYESWPVSEPGRPPFTWQIVGLEAKNGGLCLKLVGEQQTEDWSQPRADHVAWRRRDTVWLAPQLAIAKRVERVIERREPGHRDPTSITEVAYDLSSDLRYSNTPREAREEEILRACKFLDEARLLWKDPVQNAARLDALLRKMEFALDPGSHLETPYRQAIVHVQRQVRQARKGEAPVEVVPEEILRPLPAVRVGQRAPDFVVSELTGGQAVRLHQLLGRPVLIFFYNPATEAGGELLRFARGIHERYRSQVALLPMAATQDTDLVRRQHQELRLPFSVLDGHGLRLTFGVDVTPKLVVLDAAGIVRGTYTGWGDHVPREVLAELQRWLVREP